MDKAYIAEAQEQIEKILPNHFYAIVILEKPIAVDSNNTVAVLTNAHYVLAAQMLQGGIRMINNQVVQQN